MDRIISKTDPEPQLSTDSNGSKLKSSLRGVDHHAGESVALVQQLTRFQTKDPTLERANSPVNECQSVLECVADTNEENTGSVNSRPIFCPKPPAFLICPSINGQSFIHHLDPSHLRYIFTQGDEPTPGTSSMPKDCETDSIALSGGVESSLSQAHHFTETVKSNPFELLADLVNYLWKILSSQIILKSECMLSPVELPILKSFLDRKYPSLKKFWTAE